MGLDIIGLRFLLDSQASGTSFAQTVTLGRQTLFVTPEGLTVLGPRLHRTLTVADGRRLLEEADGFCEPVLRLLGADDVRAVDVSPYQGAAIVHDMNTPLPATLHESCTALLDGGTLEHVFDVRQALKNCMEMVREGGHFIAITPTNNHMGHGFYQFSPELFFRVFSPANGYVIERMLISEEDGTAPRFFDVADPERVGRRVTLINRYPASLMVRARRVAVVPIFASVPQQSDYVPVWSRSEPGMHSDAERVRDILQGGHRMLQTAWRVARPFIPSWMLNQLRAIRRGPNAFDASSYTETDLL